LLVYTKDSIRLEYDVPSLVNILPTFRDVILLSSSVVQVPAKNLSYHP
jgi:hypothetical protein